MRLGLVALTALSAAALAGCSASPASPVLPERLKQEQQQRSSDIYAVQHNNVMATSFQVGKIYDPSRGDQGQSLSSAWDSQWAQHYGGCDGIGAPGLDCEPDVRTAANDYFPTQMKPLQNPFYVALPLDDTASDFTEPMPWPSQEGKSALKDRWVKVEGPSGVCYAQVEDDGPADHNDANYVLRGSTPYQAGPAIALSPALGACVGVTNGTVSWSFVKEAPQGAWTKLITR